MSIDPAIPLGPGWIDELSDEQCKEIFWLYLESPDEFLQSHPAPLLGAAMRYALRRVVEDTEARRSGSPIADREAGR